MKHFIAFFIITISVFLANAQSEQTQIVASDSSVVDTTYINVMTNAELTNAILRIDNDIRKAGTLISGGCAASISGTLLTFVGTIAGRNKTNSRVAIATSVIGGLAGIVGAALIIAGASKMRDVRITSDGIAITF